MPGGRLVVATFDPAHFGGYWVNRLFPSVEAIDRARFPSRETLDAEVERAGFTDARLRPLTQRAVVDREAALRKIEGKWISTVRLLSEEEFEAGLARARTELPETIEYALEWLIAVAA
jgi:hypothetical protein